MKKIHIYLICLSVLFLFVFAFCVLLFLRRVTTVDIDSQLCTETTSCVASTTGGTTTTSTTMSTTFSQTTTSNINTTTTGSDILTTSKAKESTSTARLATTALSQQTELVATECYIAEATIEQTESALQYTDVQDQTADVSKHETYESDTETSTCTTTTVQSCNKEFVKTFSRGTYYCYGRGSIKGGSGRWLIDCSTGDGTVKGSIACRYIYEHYGYKKNGRTMVYLESPNLPCLTGYYYVDDCCASNDTIDFYYGYASNCPFETQGVVRNIDCYIVL